LACLREGSTIDCSSLKRKTQSCPWSPNGWDGRLAGDPWEGENSYDFEVFQVVENQPFSFEWLTSGPTISIVVVEPLADHFSFNWSRK